MSFVKLTRKHFMQQILLSDKKMEALEVYYYKINTVYKSTTFYICTYGKFKTKTTYFLRLFKT